ncbi:MAG TPA: hypothetical protein VGW75_03425 [Solirubrobacteraceae bacterium]|nr:hypothetical protein [Solirubrobacteraceae bacterium]
MPPFAETVEQQALAPARLRALLAGELARSEGELARPRSGYGEPVTVAFGGTEDGQLAAAVPVPVATRADAGEITERAWLVVAAAVEALVQASTEATRLRAGDLDGHLALATGPGDAELAALAFDDATAGIDRLRARGVAVGRLDVTDLREPIGPHHPLKVAHAVATLGGRPSDPASVEEHEEAVLEMLGGGQRDSVPRPHDDPDPPRRAARRILQRLDGMGKWGGYHTEFAHLSRGFAPGERALASAVGEALLEAGLLAEKPSVGQRHVFLDPRKVPEIRALIDRGELPPTLRLPDR